MRPYVRTYRLASLLLALTVLVTSAGPLVQHLCAAGLQGAMTEATSGPAHPCCGDRCPDRSDGAPAQAPDDAPCCTVAPAAPADLAAVAAPEASRAEDLPVAAAPVTLTTPAPALRTGLPLLDTGPSPPALRPHLIFSVLLI